MALPWFRFYTEWADDPKVQMLSEAHQRRLAMLFCYQCQGWLEGATEEQLSFKLRISLDELQKTRDAFQQQGFIGPDGWSLLNWEKRQRQSDHSTARVRVHRSKQKETVTVTDVKQNMKQSVTVQSREEETRREQIRLEEKRKEHSRPQGKRGGDLVPLSSFLNVFQRPSSTPLPQTRSEMIAKGYVFSNKADCKACGRPIEWWDSPKGAHLPMNPMGSDPSEAIVHLGTCPGAAEMRRAQ